MRSQEVHSTWQQTWKGNPLSFTQDGQTLVIDREPGLVLVGDEARGVDFYVRLFDAAGKELRVDPHRRIVNPPVVSRSGLDPQAALVEVLFDTLKTAPNPRGWRTAGTVDTFFSQNVDGYVDGTSGTYLTARSGAGSYAADSSSNPLYFGQFLLTGTYTLYEDFLSFDTSPLPDTDVISSAVLSGFLNDNHTSGSFILQARLDNWGTSLTTGAWVPGASLSALTLLATLDTSLLSTTAYYAFTDVAMPANVNKTGVTRMLLCSSKLVSGTAPAALEYGAFTIDHSGSSNDPKLDVTHIPLTFIRPFSPSRNTRFAARRRSNW